jgi:amidase
MRDLLKSSTKKLAAKLQCGDVSSREVVTAYLNRIEEVNPQINAVVQLTAEAALEEASLADNDLAKGKLHGLLHGVPFTIKDSFDTAGVISAGGTKGRATYVPTTDATIVARLRSEGAILLGKTNVPEFTFSDETDNLIYGRTSNPYDLSRSSGGSSGGAGAIVAAYGSSFDVGSDTGGSIRTPSHFCGITGIKPTSLRVPRTGHIVPPGGRLDMLTQVGPMARYVEDLFLLLSVIAGADASDPSVAPVPLGNPADVDIDKLKVAFYADNGVVSPTPETEQVVQAIGEALTDTCQRVDERIPPGVEHAHQLFAELWHADGGAWARKLIKAAGTTETHPSIEWSQDPSFGLKTMAAYADLVEEWDLYRKRMLDFMKEYDVVIAPVNPYPALEHGFGQGPDCADSSEFSYVKPYSLTGLPCVVVRGGTSAEGLPIGVQVVGQPWREDVALAMAARIESVYGGWQSPPI